MTDKEIIIEIRHILKDIVKAIPKDIPSENITEIEESIDQFKELFEKISGLCQQPSAKSDKPEDEVDLKPKPPINTRMDPNKSYRCEICKGSFTGYNRSQHNRTKKHLKEEAKKYNRFDFKTNKII